jgi:hypothetical protein
MKAEATFYSFRFVFFWNEYPRPACAGCLALLQVCCGSLAGCCVWCFLLDKKRPSAALFEHAQLPRDDHGCAALRQHAPALADLRASVVPRIPLTRVAEKASRGFGVQLKFRRRTG